ncbi:MAG: nucleotidyl transferase AbiEii/AbiGii toxin family protein [Rhodobacteraceae bacterium]|nr:nucleotidyl transferase AbiEii/AbiGii toxin family protein [Paracoccaceae bacterium]
MAFKGGTSLSKILGAINRFSEVWMLPSTTENLKMVLIPLRKVQAGLPSRSSVNG